MSVSENDRTCTDIAMDLTVECTDELGTRHQLDVVLGYSQLDPYAVTMTFLTADGDLTWTFGRDLLVAGVHLPTGQGDVHVAPSIGVTGRAVVHIELSSPDGHLVVQAKADQVQSFLARSQAVVAIGGETPLLDMDFIVSQLLAA